MDDNKKHIKIRMMNTCIIIVFVTANITLLSFCINRARCIFCGPLNMSTMSPGRGTTVSSCFWHTSCRTVPLRQAHEFVQNALLLLSYSPVHAYSDVTVSRYIHDCTLKQIKGQKKDET